MNTLTLIIRIMVISIMVIRLSLTSVVAQDKPSPLIKGVRGLSLVDSLETLLKTATDTTRINLLNDLAFEYRRSKPEKAKGYAEEALALSKKVGFKKGIARSLKNIGIFYYTQGNYDKAIDHYLRSLKIYEKLDDKKSIASSLNNIGIVYWQQGNYDKAMDHYLRSLRMYEELGDKKGIANSLNNIGGVYYEQGNYDKAIDHYLRSLKIYEELGDKQGIAISLNNIGEVYREQGKYEMAMEYANRSLSIAQEIGLKELIKNAYETLSTIYAKQKRFQRAYEYYQLYSEVKDSILNKESSKQIAEMEAKYETEKKEKEIEILKKNEELQKAEIEQQELLIYSIIGGSVLVLIIIIVLYNRNRIKYKLKIEKKLSDLEQQALRLQMNPHFIFNSLTSIGSYVYKQKPAKAINYLTKFAKLMRIILEYSKEAQIPIEKEREQLQHYLELEQLRFKDKFNFTIQLDEKLEDDIGIPPMLLQPLVENAILHGVVPKTDKGKIDVSFQLEQDKVVCSIVDDGVGREKATALKQEKGQVHHSMATQIIQERLAILNTKNTTDMQLKIEDLKDNFGSPCGTKAIISIPIHLT
ncbi:MAG: tetratricopeptide repeat protein [Bacteroidetes bacterium]|nr:tetratricopeptide repeat protein [Bacteroidota bacterium]